MKKIISNTRIDSKRIKEGKNTLKALIMSHSILLGLRSITAPVLHKGEAKVWGWQLWETQ